MTLCKKNKNIYHIVAKLLLFFYVQAMVGWVFVLCITLKLILLLC